MWPSAASVEPVEPEMGSSRRWSRRQGAPEAGHADLLVLLDTPDITGRDPGGLALEGAASLLRTPASLGHPTRIRRDPNRG